MTQGRLIFSLALDAAAIQSICCVITGMFYMQPHEKFKKRPEPPTPTARGDRGEGPCTSAQSHSEAFIQSCRIIVVCACNGDPNAGHKKQHLQKSALQE